MARLPLPAILALAEEIGDQVSTRPSVMTGVGAAVVDVWWTHRERVTHSGACVIKTLSGDDEETSNSLISQWSPSQPSPQMHWYTLTLSMQVPPLRQGLLSQSFMSENEMRGVSDWDSGPGVSHAELSVSGALTLVAVGAPEAFLALAAELAPGLAAAAAVRPAHVGRDVALASRRAVGRHGNRAAVDHCGGERERVPISETVEEERKQDFICRKCRNYANFLGCEKNREFSSPH